ncbi:MAG TPA: winged helix-turn-helix domain-containing protein [Terracidiphilus sp.]|jgi:transposase
MEGDRPPRLDPRARRTLTLALVRGSWASGLPSAPRTSSKVAEPTWQACGVRYHSDHIYRLLHSLGFRLETPDPRSVEPSQEGIAAWVYRGDPP